VSGTVTSAVALRDDVLALTGDLPGMPDRTLVDIVNRIGVVTDLNRHRQAESTSQRVLSVLLGKDRERQLRSLSLLAANQTAVLDLVSEVADHTAVTGLCIERLALHLAWVRDTAEAARDAAWQALDEIRELSDMVARIAAECRRRLVAVEDRVAALERTVAAQQHLDATLARLAAIPARRRLPWLCEVVVIARDVAAGPCGLAGGRHYAALLTRHLVERQTAAGTVQVAGVHAYLDEMAGALGTPQRNEIAAWILESGVAGSLALPRGPLTASIVLTAELAALPERDRPATPGRVATGLTRMRLGAPPQTIRLPELIRSLIEEQFAAAARRGAGSGG
jgi:hypothetical protein